MKCVEIGTLVRLEEINLSERAYLSFVHFSISFYWIIVQLWSETGQSASQPDSSRTPWRSNQTGCCLPSILFWQLCFRTANFHPSSIFRIVSAKPPPNFVLFSRGRVALPQPQSPSASLLAATDRSPSRSVHLRYPYQISQLEMRLVLLF